MVLYLSPWTMAILRCRNKENEDEKLLFPFAHLSCYCEKKRIIIAQTPFHDLELGEEDEDESLENDGHFGSSNCFLIVFYCSRAVF